MEVKRLTLLNSNNYLGMNNKILLMLIFFSLTFCSCKEPSKEIFTKSDVEKLLVSYTSDILEIKEDPEEITIVLDDKMYETYFLILCNDSYYKSPTLGNLNYLYNKLHQDKKQITRDFLYETLNLKTCLSQKLVEELIITNRITGNVFHLDDKISQKYEKGGLELLIDNYAKLYGMDIILNNETDFTLDELNTLIFYFYMNGYKYIEDDYSGMQKFKLRR